MTANFGKWYLFFGAFFALMFAAGWIMLHRVAYHAFGTLELPYGLFMLVPLCTALISLIGAWPITRAQHKKLGIENTGNMVVLYKAYLYMWTLLTLGMAGGGLAVIGITTYTPEFCMGNVLLISALLWLAVVLVSVLVWAAFNAWRNSELVSVLVGIIALMILCGSVGAAGYAFYEDIEQCRVNQVYEGYESDGEYPIAEPMAEAWTVDSKVMAYQFFLERMRINEKPSPVDLLRQWENSYGWHNEEWDDYWDDFYGDEEVFNRYKGAFYSLYSECMGDNSGLEAVFDFISSGEISFPERKTFRQSGVAELLKAVLTAHDDLYSRKEDGVLDEIYLVMCDNAPSQPDVVVEYFFPRLRDFMSEKAYSDICRGVGDGQECYNTQAVSAWAYSFWARRHHDGADGLTYQILKLIDGHYN